jgi:hypothetical protein
VADHPLRPATRHRLGRPLPHQLPDRTQAPPQAPEGFNPSPCDKGSHAVSAPISQSCSPLKGRLLTYYTPVCRCLSLAGKTARLACIRHTASVYPEPRSNSPKLYDYFDLPLAIQLLRCKCGRFLTRNPFTLTKIQGAVKRFPYFFKRENLP